MLFFQVKRTEEEFLVIAYSDISQLCGELIVLWNNFINLFIGKSEISQHLARLHHHQKVKRFSEAFFLIGTFTKKSRLSGNTDQYYPFFRSFQEICIRVCGIYLWKIRCINRWSEKLQLSDEFATTASFLCRLRWWCKYNASYIWRYIQRWWHANLYWFSTTHKKET